MGFKIRHNNYRGGFLVARGGGGCNRWPWTNKSLRITTNPNRSSVITVPMEIRFRGDRRMAKRRARSIHAYSSLFPSLSPSTFSFCFPPSLLHRPASRTDEKGGKRGGKGNRVMDTLDAFPVQGFAYFPWLVKHRHWGPRGVRSYIPNIRRREIVLRVNGGTHAYLRKPKTFFSFSSSFFFHLSGNGIRPISTNILEIYTPVCARQRAIHLFQSWNPMLNISLQMWFRYQYLTRTLHGNIE